MYLSAWRRHGVSAASARRRRRRGVARIGAHQRAAARNVFGAGIIGAHRHRRHRRSSLGARLGGGSSRRSASALGGAASLIASENSARHRTRQSRRYNRRRREIMRSSAARQLSAAGGSARHLIAAACQRKCHRIAQWPHHQLSCRRNLGASSALAALIAAALSARHRSASLGALSSSRGALIRVIGARSMARLGGSAWRRRRSARGIMASALSSRPRMSALGVGGK